MSKLIAKVIVGLVLRASPNVYVFPGQSTVRTNNCTVTAEGSLTAKYVPARGKAPSQRAWIYFYDRAGELEADCEAR